MKWFSDRKLYMRIHPTPFEYGLDTVLVGYALGEHPYTACYEVVQEMMNQKLDHALAAWHDHGAGTTDAELQSVLDDKICLSTGRSIFLLVLIEQRRGSPSKGKQ